MIQAPRRAVTRFFIPLIDVLLLLFCIFLLMPYVEKGALGGARLTAGQAELLQRRINQLQEQLELAGKGRESPEELKQENERLRKLLRQNPVDRFVLRSLQIDGDNGDLFYYKTTADGSAVRVNLDEEKARLLVAEDSKPPFRAGDQKLVYVIVRPPQRSLYPTRAQRRQYEGWFKGLVEVRWADEAPGTGGQKR
jgi:hypothetical protein